MDLYFHRMHESVLPQPLCFFTVHSDGENFNRFSLCYIIIETLFFFFKSHLYIHLECTHVWLIDTQVSIIVSVILCMESTAMAVLIDT